MSKYFIITFGCQMNKNDSERIATFLEQKGFAPALNEFEADLVVVNMCSIRQSAVDRVFGLAEKFKKIKKINPNFKTILTGCVLEKDKKKFVEKFDEVTKINNLLEYQPKYQNNFSAFVPISNGCNFACAYCVVPFTRGRLICRDHKSILEEAKRAIKRGMKEIWLVGQNVNDYKSPSQKEINFAKLVRMLNNIKGEFTFFFTSPHPKNFSEELIETLSECKKFGRKIHLPVQSGDNEILKKMNRNYTIEEYKNLVKKIREKIPDIDLSTDVIVGFPGEKRKHFENTVKLFKEIKFNMAYISRFSPRPHTFAYNKMKDNVSYREKKRRERILRNIVENG